MKFRIFSHGEATTYKAVFSIWRFSIDICSNFQWYAHNYEGAVVVSLGWLKVNYYKSLS